LCVEGEQANESLVSFAVTCVAANVTLPQSLELGGVPGTPGKPYDFLIRKLAIVLVGIRRACACGFGEMLSVEGSKLL
jgi:hypothetical protein